MMAAANVIILMSSVHTQSSGGIVGEKVDPIILVVASVFCVVMVAVLYWNDRR